MEILQENVIDANLQQTNINLSKSNGDSTFGDKAPQENEGSVFLTKLTNFTDKKTVNSGIFIEDGNNSNSICKILKLKKIKIKKSAKSKFKKKF